MDLLSTCSSKSLFEQFLAERRYLKNVTPATLEWYETAWKALQRAQGSDSPNLTKSALQSFVVSLRQSCYPSACCVAGKLCDECDDKPQRKHQRLTSFVLLTPRFLQFSETLREEFTALWKFGFVHDRIL
jgi:hypothetical protein